MQIVIVGAGISGLTAAWRLQKEGHHVTLIEKSARVGGFIQTKEIEGMLFEKGPHSLRSSPETLELIREIGLEKEILYSSPAANSRYLLKRGRLVKPRPYLSPRLYLEWMQRRGEAADESIADFFKRRLGQRFYEEFIDPLTLGIYAGEAKFLSMASCFPELFEGERRFGSLTRAFLFKKRKSSPIFTLRRGMESLVEALLHAFQGQLLLGETYLSYEERKVKTDRRTLYADRVILAYPALPVKRASLSIVSIGWKKKVHHPPGFGYLIPQKEGEALLGVVFDSSAFPDQNRFPEETRLTVMMPLTFKPEEIAKEALFRHLRINETPDVIDVTHLQEAIPQYEVGFKERLENYKRTLPPEVSLIGWGSSGISVNHCIKATC